jgi:hypothetical protein
MTRSFRSGAAVLTAVVTCSCEQAGSAQGETIEDTYAASSAVALVQVVEGRRVTAQGSRCGSAFIAEVIDPIKGTSDGELLHFAVPARITVGGFYLLFLIDRDAFETRDEFSAYRPVLSAACEASLPRLVPIYDFAVIRGTEPRRSDEPSKGLDFDTLWNLPPRIPARIVGYETDYGDVAVKRVDTNAMLTFIKSLD